MATSYSHTLSEIYDLTYKMLELAQSRLWQELIEAETKRSSLAHELTMFDPAAENDPNKLAIKLKEIVEINHLITELSAKEKDTSLAEYKQLKNSKKAATAYHRFG